MLLATADGNHYPIVVSQTYGHGRVAMVLTDSTWRWQLGFELSEGLPKGFGSVACQPVESAVQCQAAAERVPHALQRLGDGSLLSGAPLTLSIRSAVLSQPPLGESGVPTKTTPGAPAHGVGFVVLMSVWCVS